MTVLRTIGAFGPSFPEGPATQAFWLSSALADRGVKHFVLTYRTSHQASSQGLQVRTYTPTAAFGHYELCPDLLLDLLNQALEADLIHVHGYRNFQTDAGTLACLLNDVPLVLTSHGSIAGFRHPTWSWFSRVPNVLYDALTLKTPLRRASAIVATSQQEAREISDYGVSPSKIHVIPNAVALPRGARRSSLKSVANPTILMVSRFTSIRNIETALQGFAIASRKSPSLRLVIAGDEGPSRYVRTEFCVKSSLVRLAKDLELEDRVEFVGNVFGSKLWDMYRQATVFLTTSRYESFGNAIVEAAYFGLPIISTPVGVAPEFIASGDGGFRVSADKPEEIGSAILAITSDTNLQARMGQNNMRTSKRFSINRITDLYCSLYERVIT